MTLSLLLLAVAGLVAIFALLSRAARERDLAVATERLARIPALEEALERERGRAERLVAESGSLSVELAAARANLEQARARGGEVALVASEVLGKQGEVLRQQNREQLDALLAPLRDQMTAFQQGLSSAQVETARERERLAEQIRLLSANSAAMSSETRSLTRALKNDSQAQGAWGEMVLGTVLSRSGLREGEEYVTQVTHCTEGGGRLRPDVIVNLPDRRRIVVDSKVSLTAFSEYVGAVDEDARSQALARHASSLRAHVRGLSRKGYARAVGSELDFVILFVPIEAALAAAVQEDPGLIAFAAEHDVALSTPTTLLVALRTAASIWQVERRNRNAEAIAERAGKLHDRFVAFAEELTGVGTGLDRARAAYDAALGKLSSGPGNLVRQVEMLKELGARSTKALPLELVDTERETG